MWDGCEEYHVKQVSLESEEIRDRPPPPPFGSVKLLRIDGLRAEPWEFFEGLIYIRMATSFLDDCS